MANQSRVFPAARRFESYKADASKKLPELEELAGIPKTLMVPEAIKTEATTVEGL